MLVLALQFSRADVGRVVGPGGARGHRRQPLSGTGDKFERTPRSGAVCSLKTEQ